MILKVSGGLIAGVFAGAVAVAFWPHVDLRAIVAKAAVEQPVFVKPQATIAAATAQPLDPPTAAPAAPVNAPTIDKDAVAKLSRAITLSDAGSPPSDLKTVL